MDISALHLTRNWLDDHLHAALDRVQRTGQREWFAKSMAIPAISLISAFSQYPGFAGFVAQPNGTMRLALGVIRDWRWHHWDDIARLETISHTLHAEGLPAQTALFGGISFKGSQEWPQWPAVYMALPAVSITADPSQTWLTINLRLEPDKAAPSYWRLMKPILESLESRDSEDGDQPRLVSITASPSDRDWMAGVDKASRQLREGHLHKVVLARMLTLDFADSVRISALIHSLRAQNPDATVFAIKQGSGSVFLGATPELLATVNGKRVQTMSLAGSAPRGLTPDEDADLARAMQHDPKNQREHAVVRRHVLDALGALTTSLDLVGEPTLKRLPTVQHLLTPVSAILKDDVGIWQVVKKLSPTPAVAGYPVDEAVLYIAQEETAFSRGWYAGSVGWANLAGDGQWMVSLRSGLIQRQTVRLYAGCGIMPDSDPATELRESQWKFGTMLNALSVEGDGR